jgi:arabinogalactan endo-1,4-beta-galactosidase
MKKLRTATIVLAAILASGAVPASAAEAASTLQNPGFEDGLTGWKSTAAVATGGHSGTQRLAHTGAAVTYQSVKGLAPGAYTLRVWVRGGGAASAGLTGCGAADRRVDVPRTGPDLWVQVAVSARVSGRCTITL